MPRLRQIRKLWRDKSAPREVGGQPFDRPFDKLTVPSKVERLRVKVISQGTASVGKGRIPFENIRFGSTFDIIEAAEKGLFPDKMMINTHPQRWTDKPLPWVRPGENLLRRMLSASQ